MNKLWLKKGREKAILRRHPWIYSGAIQHVEGNPDLGATVAVYSASNDFLAWAAYSPQSQIRARIWTWDQEASIDVDFLKNRIAAAAQLRKHWIDPQKTTAYRLIRKLNLQLERKNKITVAGKISRRYFEEMAEL